MDKLIFFNSKKLKYCYETNVAIVKKYNIT